MLVDVDENLLKNTVQVMSKDYIHISVIENIKNEMKSIQEAEKQIYGKEDWNFVGKCLDIIDNMKSE